jgi:hypothetical protein
MHSKAIEPISSKFIYIINKARKLVTVREDLRSKETGICSNKIYDISISAKIIFTS